MHVERKLVCPLLIHLHNEMTSKVKSNSQFVSHIIPTPIKYPGLDCKFDISTLKITKGRPLFDCVTGVYDVRLSLEDPGAEKMSTQCGMSQRD